MGDGVLVIGTSAIGDDEESDGYLLALDTSPEPTVAREKWRLPVDGAVWGGVVIEDNVAYFGTMSGTLYAVDLADGEEFAADVARRIKWRFESGGAIAGTPLVSEGKIFFGNFSNTFFALDVEVRDRGDATGDLDPRSEWSFDTGGWVWAQPLLVDGTVFISTLDGMVHAVTVRTGGAAWQEPAEIDGQVVARPAQFESNRGPALAVPSGDGGVHVVLISNGQVTGEFDTDGEAVKSTPVVIDEVLFVHTANGQVRRYRTGTLDMLSCIEARGDGKRCG